MAALYAKCCRADSMECAAGSIHCCRCPCSDYAGARRALYRGEWPSTAVGAPVVIIQGLEAHCRLGPGAVLSRAALRSPGSQTPMAITALQSKLFALLLNIFEVLLFFVQRFLGMNCLESLLFSQPHFFSRALSHQRAPPVSRLLSARPAEGYLATSTSA